MPTTGVKPVTWGS